MKTISTKPYLHYGILGFWIILLSAFLLSNRSSKTEITKIEPIANDSTDVVEVETNEAKTFTFGKAKKKVLVKKANANLVQYKNLDAWIKTQLSKHQFEDSDVEEFVSRFLKVALIEQVKYGIPVSITLAQGSIESGNGKSKLARKCRNFFGIKSFCKKERRMRHTDDSPRDHFRVTDTAWESFRMRSNMLTKEGARYECLFGNRFNSEDFRQYNFSKRGKCADKKYWNKINTLESKWNTPYMRWCFGLDLLGYATDNKYAYTLSEFIEDNKLYIWDNVKVNGVPKS